FEERGHKICESSSLIPENDSTLLFTVAGMVQFKPMFAGLVSFDFKRAASIQKCLRVVDIEEVGKSPIHDTFFEMLGNFSFGDYFQKEAISWAWEFLTKVLSIDKNRFYVTVHKDDTSAFEIWHRDVGLSESRIIVMDDKTNFWGPAGGTGACGPSSEIIYDFGEGTEDISPCSIENDCKRYVEIWNIVFPQFNQDIEGKRHPLKSKCVDTGMGLERLACVMQNKKTIFETDLFMPIIEKLCSEYSLDYDKDKQSINSIADHLRALTFAISDGIMPENDGRGYVIRRILRRALRLGYKMNIKKPFLNKFSNTVVDNMSVQYKNLITEHPKVKKIIESEESRFLKTIAQGVDIYEFYKKRATNKTISGEALFQLYDTFGFPIDLVRQMAEEDSFAVDEKKFNELLENAKYKSRMVKKFQEKESSDYTIFSDSFSVFTGYEKMRDTSKLLMFRKIDSDKVEALFERNPFYAESGGQVGDSGIVRGNDFEMIVENTVKSPLGNTLIGKIVKGSYLINTEYTLEVNSLKRRRIERNHTATHLLHNALRKVLGNHVRQEGSYVADDRLRFDFTHFSQMTEEEMNIVEKIVNENIDADLLVETDIKDYEEAVNGGAIALFKEKYKDKVRVVTIDGISQELCGGTHVQRTSQIGMFRILTEQSIAAGIRRIECITSFSALKIYEREREILIKANEILGIKATEEILLRLQKITEEMKIMEKEREERYKKEAKLYADKIIETAIKKEKTTIVFSILEKMTIDNLRLILDNIKYREKSLTGFLGSLNNGIMNYIVFSQNSNNNAKDIIKKVNSVLSGKGGGNADFSSGSTKVLKNKEEMLEQVKKAIME
ncbi:MAG: alanine--tRNA ligase, partial [bacterium (Candidatus Stahlbacteria) CG23_combo_of_CG06-09_8_20_14_all_34_7]